VHLDLRCVELAEKRRAFPRALRLVGPLDVSPVRDHVAAVLEQRATSTTAQRSDSTELPAAQPTATDQSGSPR
jgi:hypothetical protein